MNKNTIRNINLRLSKILKDKDLAFLYKILDYSDKENIVDFKRFKYDYGFTDSKLSRSKKPLLDKGILRMNKGFIYLNPLVWIRETEMTQEWIKLFEDTFEQFNIKIVY